MAGELMQPKWSHPEIQLSLWMFRCCLPFAQATIFGSCYRRCSPPPHSLAGGPAPPNGGARYAVAAYPSLSSGR